MQPQLTLQRLMATHLLLQACQVVPLCCTKLEMLQLVVILWLNFLHSLKLWDRSSSSAYVLYTARDGGMGHHFVPA